MNFLTRFLTVDAPENTALHAADLSFRGISTLWLAALVAVVLLGLLGVIVFYRLEKGTLGWIRRSLLIVLRSALLFLLLFLILRPVLLAEFIGQRPNGVALLIDNSQSMTLRDRRLSEADKARVAIALNKLPLKTKLDAKIALPANLPSDPPRTELVRGILSHPELKLVNSLERFGPLRPYFFGYDLRGLTEDKKNVTESILAGFKAEDGRTALADAVMKVLEAKDADLPSAIVVISDGQDNASKYGLTEAAEKCQRAGVPLHIWGVGSAEGGQLQLKEVAAPETLFVDDTVSIPLRWRAQGFKKGTAEVIVTLGGKEIARRKLPMQTGEDLRDVINMVVPKDPQQRDTQDLVATIRYKSGNEVFTDTLTRSVRVADSKIRILYIEHSPRWEFKFLQPALLRDRRIEAEFILVNGDPKITKAYDERSPYLAEFPKTRDKFFEGRYNLLILGDVNSSYFSREQQEWIREFVQNRGGLIVMAGRQYMPSSYEGTPIADLLPVEFTKQKFGLDSEQRTQEYPPTLTDAGQRADWLSLADTPEENLDIWQTKLLGFHWFYPVTKLRPAATPLVVNPRAKMGEQPMPILATQYFGRGQVLWVGTDETWRWRWNYQDKYFIRFWGQIVYQLGLPSLLGDGAKRAAMALDRSQAIVGTGSTIYVRLLDKEFNPRRDPKIEAELEYLDAKSGDEKKTSVTFYPLRGRPGEYSALVNYRHAGRVELRVKNPELNTFPFRVDLPPKHELEESGLNEKGLRDAAELSGGRFYREEDLHSLADNIVQKKTTFTRRQEILLWNPLAILVFIGLITVEWVVRKFSDLS